MVEHVSKQLFVPNIAALATIFRGATAVGLYPLVTSAAVAMFGPPFYGTPVLGPLNPRTPVPVLCQGQSSRGRTLDKIWWAPSSEKARCTEGFSRVHLRHRAYEGQAVPTGHGGREARSEVDPALPGSNPWSSRSAHFGVLLPLIVYERDRLGYWPRSLEESTSSGASARVGYADGIHAGWGCQLLSSFLYLKYQTPCMRTITPKILTKVQTMWLNWCLRHKFRSRSSRRYASGPGANICKAPPFLQWWYRGL